MSAPTSSGLVIATATLSSGASYKIGQYFKEQASNNADGQLTCGQEAAHILAHTILGAAVAAAGGNDELTAGLYRKLESPEIKTEWKMFYPKKEN